MGWVLKIIGNSIKKNHNSNDTLQQTTIRTFEGDFTQFTIHISVEYEILRCNFS